MNGVAKVTIKGKEYPLKFGVQAMLVYEEEVNKNPLVEGVAAGMAATCIVLYAGLIGNSIRSRQPVMPFEEVYDLMYDGLALEPDFNTQVTRMWDVFNESIQPIVKSKEDGESVKKKAPKK